MTPLQEHEALKPAQPKPLKDMTQAEYKAWSEAMSTWLWKRDAIVAAEIVKDRETPLEAREKVMREKACLPRADYQWRDIPKRSHKSKPVTCWRSNPTEYNRTKKAESRAKKPCKDCGGVKVEKKSRCLECQAKAEEAQRLTKNLNAAFRKADQRAQKKVAA